MERLEAGEATQLAASPEVRETIERAGLETILRLNQEEQIETLAPEPDAATKPRTAGEEDFPFTKEELLEIHAQALMLLWPLEVAFVVLALAPATSPVGTPLALAVGGLTVLIKWSEEMIARWEN